MSLYYLSFADPELPPGSQWLGAIIIQADNFIFAVAESHRLGINPGGEVQGAEIEANVPAEFQNKLLSKDDLIDMGEAITGTRDPDSVIRWEWHR